MVWQMIFAFLPDEALPLLIVAIAAAVILGLLTIRRALVAIGLLLVLLMLTPFIEAVMDALPPWIALILIVAVVLSLIRGVIALFIGERATATMVGSLAADLVRFLVGILVLPFRLLFWAIRASAQR